ncbi:hypothetical protein O3M35_012439 [Rhynocoris fuscipes]|uniref:Uncharacterized protein n=1 Tax=Rhynocoris fuscipes TaxID=488301 RepID=A0AAW1CY29_9HEMI
MDTLLSSRLQGIMLGYGNMADGYVGLITLVIILLSVCVEDKQAANVVQDHITLLSKLSVISTAIKNGRSPKPV